MVYIYRYLWTALVLARFSDFWIDLGVILLGTLSGALLPLLMRRLGFDPATSSAPFVATIVDVVGVLIYFLTSLFILRGTLL